MILQNIHYQRWFLLVILFSVTWSCSTPESSQQLDPVVEEKQHQLMLWEASKGEQRLYILGTFHLGISPDELDRLVWDYLQESQLVILEMDISNVNPGEALPYMFLPPEQSLQNILEPKAWQELKKRLSPQIPEEKLERLSLTAVFQILIGQIAPHGESIDLAILKKARAAGKTTAFLETFAFQAQLLQTFIEPEMIADLLTKQDEARQFFNRMVDIYLAGDPQKLDQLIREQDSEFAMSEDQFQTMVVSRNRRWLKILPEILGQEPAFIAVGAGHLPGPDGLLSLLEEEGYQLRRLGS
ncbi:MAG: TraB/GumN family protein [Oligoflexus sp.]